MTAGHDTAIIASLQEEIAAAQKKRAAISELDRFLHEKAHDEFIDLGGYIKGLNMALYLQTRQPVRELEF